MVLCIVRALSVASIYRFQSWHYPLFSEVAPHYGWQQVGSGRVWAPFTRPETTKTKSLLNPTLPDPTHHGSGNTRLGSFDSDCPGCTLVPGTRYFFTEC